MKLLPDEQRVMQRIEKACISVCTVLASTAFRHRLPSCDLGGKPPNPPAAAETKGGAIQVSAGGAMQVPIRKEKGGATQVS